MGGAGVDVSMAIDTYDSDLCSLNTLEQVDDINE